MNETPIVLNGGESQSLPPDPLQFKGRQKRKTVACRRCHAQKIKCNGGKPCKNCRLSNHVADCAYPLRDRKITVNESFIKKLQAENDRLKRESISASNSIAGDAGPVETSSDITDPATGNPDNPLLEDEAWFVSFADPDSGREAEPMWVGEAACTAFSTRFRQLLLNNRTEAHRPRTQFVQDSQLVTALDAPVQWPSRPQAMLLVETTLSTVGKCYYLSTCSSMRTMVERAYRDTTSLDALSMCKLFTIFALGEIHSSRLSMRDNIPAGLLYFAKATKLLRVIPERPRIEHIELLILFSLYSLAVNRRHSAYRYMGSAMRLALTIGLHQNIRESDLPDKAARQHRIRVWWTIYVVDHLLGAKFGYPTFIRDDDIDVDLPSDLPCMKGDDMISADYLVASIKLGKIAGVIITNLYSRKRLEQTFSQRVHKIFRDLRNWFETLSPELQLRNNASVQVARHILFLHLTFNQCVILATRPILLHVFRVTHSIDLSGASQETQEIPHVTSALAETCVHSARHSYRLLSRSWVDGSFSTLDHTSAQYLYAAATVLAVSSLSFSANSQADKDDFESAAHLLRQLRDLGNISAQEFCYQSELMIKNIAEFEATRVNVIGAAPFEARNSFDTSGTDFSMRLDPMAPDMGIFGPLVQDFLSQTDAELGVPLPLEDIGFDGLDFWSSFSGQDAGIVP